MASSSTPSSAWRDRRDSVPTHMASETNQSGQSSRHASVSVRRAGHVHRFRPMSRPSDKRQTTADRPADPPPNASFRPAAVSHHGHLPRCRGWPGRSGRSRPAEHRREWRTPRCHPVGRAPRGTFHPLGSPVPSGRCPRSSSPSLSRMQSMTPHERRWLVGRRSGQPEYWLPPCTQALFAGRRPRQAMRRKQLD